MTIKEPTLLQRLTGRILEFFTTAAADIITRVRSVTRRWRSSYSLPTNDWSRADYDWWDRVYYGRVKGLGLSGLLIKPVISKIASWTLGRAPQWKTDGKSSAKALNDWWTKHHDEILAAWEAALKQGDAFLVVNSDLSVTLLAPDCVDPIVADDDYSLIIGWRVTQVLIHPETTARMTFIDEYYLDRRIHRVQVNGITQQETVYPNLLGRLQIVHIANVPSAGQVFGHPETEGLVELLHKYGEVVDAAIEGNVLQGRPTPVMTFDTIEDLDKFDDENASFETQELPNGTSQRVKTYDLDLSQLIVASGADFEYKAPGAFTADTVNILQILYYLALEHQELPEFVMGNAIQSSQASANTQMPVFIEFIKGRRGKMGPWLVEIAAIVLAYMSLMMARVRAQEPTLQWEALDQEDGTLTLETIKWAYSVGLLDDLTAISLMPVEVEDPEAVLAQAKLEREERAAQALAAAQAAQPTPTPNAKGGKADASATVAELMPPHGGVASSMSGNEIAGIVTGAIRQLAGVEDGY